MRRVLVVPVGLVPQVVTEAIFALAHEDPPWFPDELYLITTQSGRERIESQLLPTGESWLGRLIDEYQLPSLALPAENILQLHDSTGCPLSDIRSPSEMSIAADAVVELLNKLVSEEDTEIHTVISGSRTSLGFYLGYAMSLYGRVQDRLSHVFVPSELEKHPGFFYPPKEPKTLYSLLNGNHSVDASMAFVELVDIPFVRMRYGLADESLREPRSFSQLISFVQSKVSAPSLVVNCEAQTVYADEREVPMPPLAFAWLLWLVERHHRYGGEEAFIKPDCPLLAKEFLGVYRRVSGELSHDYEVACEKLKDGLERSFIWERNSRIRACFSKSLGTRGDIYSVMAFGERPRTLYGLGLPLSAMQVL